jgi:hypothetical protein
MKQISIKQVQNIFPNINYKKILLENNLKIYYSEINCNIKIFKNNKEVSEFSILCNQHISGISLHMEIRIEDPTLNKKGLAQLMIGLLLIKLIEKNPNIRYDQLLFVDGDASNGFWDHIGMKKGRYSYMLDRKTKQTNLESYGYEKEITFSNISMWALNKRLGI